MLGHITDYDFIVNIIINNWSTRIIQRYYESEYMTMSALIFNQRKREEIVSECVRTMYVIKGEMDGANDLGWSFDSQVNWVSIW